MEPASLEGRAQETITEGPRAEEAEGRVLLSIIHPLVSFHSSNLLKCISVHFVNRFSHPHIFVIVACSSALGFSDSIVVKSHLPMQEM